MASNLRPHAVVFIIIIIGIFFLTSSVDSIPTEELDSMLETLRIRGYELFCNAIVTSDLQFELLSDQNNTRSSSSYTFFAPIDSSLFALDMTQTASSYTDTLRFHIVPRRLSITDLLGLSAGTSLPTLLFRRYLNVTQSPGSVSVGGVDVAFPGLFYGRYVAVHGLNGIISLRSSTATRPVSGFWIDRRSSPPRSGSSASESHSVMAPAREPGDADSFFYAASPFHPEQSNPLENPMIQALDDSSSLASSPFNPAVDAPEPDEPNSLDNLMIHAPENSHSNADLLFNREADRPESNERNSLNDIMILPPEYSHSYADSPFNQAVHPPEPDGSNSLENLMIDAPEDSQVSAAAWQFNRAFLPTEPKESSSQDNPMIHTPEASTTESPGNVYDRPPVVSHALTPTSESPEYRHSSISAPSLEYSDAEVPTAMSHDEWPPNKHGVELIETFNGDSDGLIQMGHDADEVPKMPQPPLIDAQEMPGKHKPLDGTAHCVDPDVGLGLHHSTHQCRTCRYVCE